MPEVKKILLVDDEKRILETFSFVLEDMDYYVKTASEPEDAMRLVAEEEFDIAFVDQFLGPELGVDLMKRMSEKDPDIYFVIITANASTELAVESLKTGASDFISKPFTTSDLLKSIEYVNKKRALDIQRRELLEGLEATVSEKTAELEGVYFSVLASLAQAMEKKDMGTYGHSRRVGYVSRLIAASLDLSKEETGNLRSAALLHDIGKIGISDFILGKKGPLDEDEALTVKSHPQKGVEILRPVAHFKPILPAILHHHEQYDGSGYPDGLSGDSIPLNARIIAIGDTYDAILSNRPYRSALDTNTVISELVENAGSQFDPFIVDAFVGAFSKYKKLFGELTLVETHG